MSRRTLIVSSLLIMALALIAVGFVSHSVARHALQVLPLLLAGAVQGRRWGPAAAVGVSLFWIVIMALIWAFLLGVVRIITGTYSPAEIVLTVMVAGGALAAVLAALGAMPRAGRPLSQLLAFVGFAALQFVAVAASYELPMPRF